MAEEKIVTPISNTSSQQSEVTQEETPTVEIDSKVEQAKQLKDNINNQKSEIEDFQIIGDDYTTNPIWYEVNNYFGIPQEEWLSAKDEIIEIVKYAAREVNSTEMDKILSEIRKIEDNLYERPQWGEKRYKVIYRYIRLSSKKQSIERAMKSFEK